MAVMTKINPLCNLGPDMYMYELDAKLDAFL